MSDFLLELRSEEIPARMQAGARAELEKLFRREMDAAGVTTGEITVWSTPRRLALIARDLPEATDAVSEELKGPPVGAPDQAIDGFCRKAGVDKGDLEVREVKGRETYFAVKDIPGRQIIEVLENAITPIVWDFAWPKSMRWGAESVSTSSIRWVRPLSGILAVLDDKYLKLNPYKHIAYGSMDDDIDVFTTGADLYDWQTVGHRFHSNGKITVKSVDDYRETLRAAFVIVDHEERQDLIRTGAAKVASEAGLKLVEDEGLVIENAGLTEWPVPLLGRFEEDFLEVPPETIQLTARVNQKYFVCEDDKGNLANAFICTANIEAEDGGARVVDGNRKVLAARLSDARFFWDVDRKKTLAEHAKGLERITFHEKLGTVADKVDRVAKLARWLVEEGVVKGADPDMAEQAARLAKADLVTEMVGEFPELQGLMGGYYARAEGLPDEVADAIRDHYKPVGQGDDVPTAPETVAVSLADKLDSLAMFFGAQMTPTGSKDPFALRRAALGSLQIIQRSNLRLNISRFARAIVQYAVFKGELEADKVSGTDDDPIYRLDPIGKWSDYDIMIHAAKVQDSGGEWVELTLENANPDNLINAVRLETKPSDLLDFFADRLKVQQREAGVRHDLIDAVFALGGEDDLVRLLARVKALQSFMDTEDGANLLAGYKRAANILRKEDWHGIEGEIARTGEEDPLALVDDPDMRAVIEAKMAERHAKELSYEPEPAEKALMDALAKSEPAAAQAIEAEDFSGAMAALAALRAPIDRFFDEVTVNADEENKRAHRLDLLAAFRAAVHKVADFSRIEG